MCECMCVVCGCMSCECTENTVVRVQGCTRMKFFMHCVSLILCYLIHHAVSPPLWRHQSWPRSVRKSPAVQSPLLRSSYWTAGRSPELHHPGGTPEQCSITYAVKRVVSVTLAFTHCSLSSIRSCTSPANYLDHTMAVY